MGPGDDDPHGSRGSTQHHALDYKKEVKSFSSADILAAYKSAGRGAPDRGVPSHTRDKAPDAVDAARGQSGVGSQGLNSTGSVKSFNSADLVSNVSQARRSGFATDNLTGAEPSGTKSASAATPDAASSTAASPANGVVAETGLKVCDSCHTPSSGPSEHMWEPAPMPLPSQPTPECDV